MQYRFIPLLLLLVSALNSNAQLLNRDTTLTITEGNITFNSAFAGGINSGQFSEIDLDLDVEMDNRKYMLLKSKNCHTVGLHILLLI